MSIVITLTERVFITHVQRLLAQLLCWDFPLVGVSVITWVLLRGEMIMSALTSGFTAHSDASVEPVMVV